MKDFSGARPLINEYLHLSLIVEGFTDMTALISVKVQLSTKEKKVDILFKVLIFQRLRETTQFWSVYSTNRTICLKGNVTCGGFVLCGRWFVRCVRTRVGSIVTVVGYYIVILIVGNASCKREKCFIENKVIEIRGSYFMKMRKFTKNRI